ncbi:MAG: HAD family hydrolase [Bacilli bacterium]|nr:HAD family hydrolase [Bacilli bacterium]
MYKAVLFDLDGTILNTLDDLFYSTNYALEKYNLKKRTYEEIRCFVGNGVKVLIEKAVGENHQHLVDNVILEFKNHYKEHSLDHIKEYDGIKEVLIELKRKGLKLAVVTNKFNQAAQDIINKYFNGIFDIVLGETKELNRKPHPDMCNYVLKELGINPSEALYVGDSDVDILTAKNAGLKCISCSWGFKTKDELISFEANIIIDIPTELLGYLN